LRTDCASRVDGKHFPCSFAIIEEARPSGAPFSFPRSDDMITAQR
jgi:hypothetical protein